MTSPSATRRVLAPVCVAIGDADRAAVLDLDPAHARVEAHRQAWIVCERLDEGIGRAAALSAPVHELVEADAALRRAVEVVVERLAERLHGLHEPARQVVDMAGVGDQQRTVGAVPLVVQPVVALHAAKMRQHVVPAPAGIVIVAAQQLVPFIVVRRDGRACRPAR